LPATEADILANPCVLGGRESLSPQKNRLAIKVFSPGARKPRVRDIWTGFRSWRELFHVCATETQSRNGL